MDFLKRCWAEIDLEAVRYNYEQYRKLVPENIPVMCVVKAACYGHDDRLIVPFLQNELGVRYFAVSNLDEAVRLRELGITGEILILGYTPPEYADILSEQNLLQACTEADYARRLSSIAKGTVRLHIAVDTGMTRIGLHDSADNCAREIAEIARLENISAEGIFTHYSSADGITPEDEEYTKAQTEKFLAVRDKARALGVKLEQAHILNSAGGAYGYCDESTLARLGIILYGLYPDPAKALPFKPKPVMKLKAVVSQVKEISAGESVSYGRTFTADKPMKLATVTAGYADGYPRKLSNIGEVVINNTKCPIRGRICMDQFMCDVTDAGEVRPGDVAELMNEEINADVIAALTGTIGYEVTCVVTSRVPRIAVK